MKGSALGIGAWSVADLAEAAEGLVGGDHGVARRQQIEALRAALREVAAFIAARSST